MERLVFKSNGMFKSTVWRNFGKWSFVVIRILFGLAWLMAGITKVTDKSWFREPGIFLQDYLLTAMEKPNVPEFYQYFIEHVVLNHLLFFNYAIPVAQIVVGLFLIAGFMTFPSILVCLFMHINFILSGNMNVISLTLYTSAFILLLSGRRSNGLSLDRYFKLEDLFPVNKDNPAGVVINPIKKQYLKRI